VAEDFHDHPGWHTLNEKHGCAGVAQVVEAYRRQTARPDDGSSRRKVPLAGQPPLVALGLLKKFTCINACQRFPVVPLEVQAVLAL
jgi:hypothetical protein